MGKLSQKTKKKICCILGSIIFTIFSILFFILFRGSVQSASGLLPFEVRKGIVTICTCQTGKCTRAAKNPHYEAHYVNAFASVVDKFEKFGYDVMVLTEFELFGLSKYRSSKNVNGRMLRRLEQTDLIVCGLPMMAKLEEIYLQKNVTRKPSYMIVEFTDTASLLPYSNRRDTHVLPRWNDTIYEFERLKAIVLHTSLHPVELNNENAYLGSYYYGQLVQFLYPWKNYSAFRSPPLPKFVLDKIYPLTPHVGRYYDECLMYVWKSKEQMKCRRDGYLGNLPQDKVLKPMEMREIDVLYAGSLRGDCTNTWTTEYPNTVQLVNGFRCKIYHILEKISRSRSGLRIELRKGILALQDPKILPYKKLVKLRATERKKFLELAENAKICISPGGFGEFATKDFEYAIMGCVILKPGSRSLDSFDKLYSPGASLTSSYNLSDFEDVILRNVYDNKKLDEIARHAKKLLDTSLESFPAKVAEVFDKIM